MGREETTAAFLASTVTTAVFPANGTTKAVHQARKEETGRCGPHESECLGTKACFLAVAMESIAALDEDGAVNYS